MFKINLIATILGSLILTASATQATSIDILTQPRNLSLGNGPFSDNLQASEWFQVGLKHYYYGDIQATQTAMLEAIASDPFMSMAYYMLGNTLIAQDKPEEAMDRYKQAIDLNPREARAYNNLGVALSYQGKNEEALTQYQTAVETDPNLSIGYYNLGVALNLAGKHEQAVIPLNIATDLSLKAKNKPLAFRVKEYIQCAIVPYLSTTPSRLLPICDNTTVILAP